MKKYIILVFVIFSCNTKNEKVSVVAGVFSGDIIHGNFSGTIEIELKKDSSGWQAYYTNYEENAIHIPFQETTITGDSVRCGLRGDAFTLDFRSRYDAEANSLTGVLNADTISIPYTLKNKTGDISNTIKQEEVEYLSDSILVHGTIWKPAKPNGHALIILTSSGNWDRSASRGLCLYFAKQGFIAFHYDKRGTGNTKGSWVNAPMEKLVEDDINAIEFFTKHTGILLTKTGITGSSQGAAKIPQILNQLTELNYGVVVSCPGSTLLESDLNYWKNRNLKNIVFADQASAIALQQKSFMSYAGLVDNNELKKQLDVNKEKPWFKFIEYPEASDGIDSKLLYSPIPYFEKTTHPLLIIQGMEDEIIPVNSFHVIESALQKAGNKNYEILKFSETNHSMQFTGRSDFPFITKLQPAYLPTVLKWIKNRGGI